VKRVQKALALLHTNPRLSLALVALRCGYFDQAHFNRDFRRITGVAPRAYLAGRTDHQNHVAVTVG
jgi:transcriptional regulator GlxA family with amidase domain